MLGHELRELRRKQNILSRDLAAAMNLNPATLSRYENGHSPIPRLVELAALYLCEPKVVPSTAGERLISALKEALNHAPRVEDNRNPPTAVDPHVRYGGDQVSV